MDQKDSLLCFVTVLFVALIVGRFVYNIFFHPLSALPGPLLYRGSELPKIFQQLRGNINFKVTELHEIYGPVLRISPGEVTFSSAQAMKDIYGNRSGKPLSPDPIYGLRDKEFFGAVGLLWLDDPVEHARHRRLLAHGFSDQSLRRQEPIVKGYTDMLMSQLRKRAGQKTDMLAWFNFATFDIIGDLTVGDAFGCLRNGDYHPWISFIYSRIKAMLAAQIIATMGKWAYIVELLVPKSIITEALQHANWTKDMVNRRLATQTDRPDFMTHILQHTVEGKDTVGDAITLNELYADSQILIIAGSDTTATLLSAALYNLLRNPHAMETLKSEIRSAYSSEDEITFSSASKRRYLQAVISEALRIQPPLPSGINRLTNPEGSVIDGHFISGNTNVSVHHWAAYHLSANFTDPHSFAPERWLGDERFAGDNRDVFYPFSLGARNCLGRNLAYMEARLILARLFWNFDIELISESEDWGKRKIFLLYEKSPLNVILTDIRRESGTDSAEFNETRGCKQRL